jgi:uridine phosphorylase
VYVPLEFPSVASFSMVQAAQTAAAELGMNSRVIAGFVHSKDSLFAREMGEGPMRKDNESYMALLREAGVAASEMEAAHLFVLGSLFSQQLQRTGDTRGVLCGAVLGIIGDDQAFATDEIVKKTVEDTVQLALATVKMLAVSELTG